MLVDVKDAYFEGMTIFSNSTGNVGGVNMIKI